MTSDRQWLARASEKIQADFCRSSDTHLLPVPLPTFPGIRLYLKDESCHVTGSLKHRLARSLFLHALVNGHIHEGTTVVEASSGSTAISEAYFARLLGLPFVAVMPASTSADKIALIEAQGGRCHLVDDGATVYAVAQQLASDARGYYMDQFTNAERATDWRGNNNIAETIFDQMSREAHPIPRWIVVGRRHRRHRVDDRSLHPLPRIPHAAVCGRSAAFRHLRLLPHRRCDAEAGSRIRRRGDRQAAGRTVVHPHGRRPDDQGPG